MRGEGSSAGWSSRRPSRPARPHNVPALKRPGRLENRLTVHPEDAAERGLADGQRVRVRNVHGEVEVRLSLDDGLMRGVVALTHGWGHAGAPGMRTASRYPGANANRLLPTGPGSYEPLSNQAFMTGVPVELDALPAPSLEPPAASA